MTACGSFLLPQIYADLQIFYVTVFRSSLLLIYANASQARQKAHVFYPTVTIEQRSVEQRSVEQKRP
jgi:hypothetical protein